MGRAIFTGFGIAFGVGLPLVEHAGKKGLELNSLIAIVAITSALLAIAWRPEK